MARTAVLWLPDLLPVAARRIVEQALQTQTEAGLITYEQLDGTPTPEMVQEVVLAREVDAVLAPLSFHSRLRPSTASVFDLAWLSDRPSGAGEDLPGEDLPDVPGFAQIPGSGPGFLSAEGGLSGFPDSIAWRNLQDVFTALDGLLGPPVVRGGSPGAGRVGSVIVAVGVVTGVVSVIQGFVSAVKSAVQAHDAAAAAERAVEEFNHEVDRELEKLDQEEDDDHPSMKEDGIDDDGVDFLLLLNELAARLQTDEVWRAMLAGTLPPDSHDSRDEFLYFLQLLNLRDQTFSHAVRDGRPVPEGLNDSIRTWYGLLFWLWTEGGREARRSSVWEYWWRRGAPIDPMAREASRSVVGLGGSLLSRRQVPLKLDFVL